MGQRVSRNLRRPCPHDDGERQPLLGDIHGSRGRGTRVSLQDVQPFDQVEVKASVPEDPCKSSNQEDEGYGSLQRVPGCTTTSILKKDLVSKKSVVRYKILKETHERVRRRNGYFERIRLRIVFPPP